MGRICGLGCAQPPRPKSLCAYVGMTTRLYNLNYALLFGFPPHHSTPIVANILFFLTNPSLSFFSTASNMPFFPIAPAPTDQDEPEIMNVVSRTLSRDARIYASDSLYTLLGGLWIAEGTTNANLYSMLEIICIFSDTFDLQLHGGPLIKRDSSQLQPGNYFVVTNGKSLRPSTISCSSLQIRVRHYHR